MFRILLLSLCIISFTHINAQQKYALIDVGVNKMGVGLSDSDSEARVGFSMGLGFGNNLSNRIFYETQIIYQQRGFETDFTILEPGQQIFNRQRLKVNAGYVAIPMKIGIIGQSDLKPFVAFGIMPAILAGVRSISLTLKNEESKVSINNFVTSFNWSILAEGGLIYPIDESFNIKGTIGYQQSLNSFFASEVGSENALKIGGLTFNVGISKYLTKI